MGRTNVSGLTPTLVEELRRKGLKQKEIAEMYGVSPQYVSALKKMNKNYKKTPREEAMAHYPWKIGVRFHDAEFNKRMRDHAEYMASRGIGMDSNKLGRLARFYRRLIDEDAVVEFDPNIPPTERNMPGGFALRKRQPSDGDLIIRKNEYTHVSEEGEALWRFPPKLPDVT